MTGTVITHMPPHGILDRGRDKKRIGCPDCSLHSTALGLGFTVLAMFIRDLSRGINPKNDGAGHFGASRRPIHLDAIEGRNSRTVKALASFQGLPLNG